MHLVTLPTLLTPRLRLRPFAGSDAARVELLAGNAAVSRYTAKIPHPYPPGSAAKWIATHLIHFLDETAIYLAVQEKAGPLIGAMQLSLEKKHRHAELGYWIGEPFWGRGFATEAARALLEYGFREWDLHRIYAQHLAINPASGKVLQKLGMTREGILREHTRLRDPAPDQAPLTDMIIYGLLRREWQHRP